MRAFGTAALVATMLAISPALAENNLDLSKVTRKGFLGAGKAGAHAPLC